LKGLEMPLQVGYWTIVSNWLKGTLLIEAVSAQGVVSGKLDVPNLSDFISGWWDEESQRVDFSIAVGPPPPHASSTHGSPHAQPSPSGANPPDVPPPAGAPTQEAMQVFSGFLFEDRTRITGVSGSTVFTLAGYSESFGSGGTAQQQGFWWYAQIGVD
jgi:hypothetical protein